MSKRIITVSREFGSGGRHIAEQVAKRLGYQYYDKRKIILDVADKEPCVIVGRCADEILRERDDCLNVFICGNVAEKTERIVRLYNLTEKEAQKKMREIDKKRSIHYDYYTDQKWGDARNYSISLNSSDVGYDRAIAIICTLAKEL